MDGRCNERQRMLPASGASGDEGLQFGLSVCQFSVLVSQRSAF